jgi:O-antigen/teichoic acid export membrane protein
MANLTRRIALPLYVNSFYLISSTVISSGLGFIFWMLAARSTSAAEIGIATAAIASVNLLITLCDLGLGTTLIYYASAERVETTTLLNTTITVGWLCISVGATIFIIGIPFWSAGLMPIRDGAALVILFILFTAINYILGLQDAAMVSKRRAYYVLLRNLACNIPSVLLLLPLVNLIGGYPSILMAYSMPNIIIGLIAGIVVLPYYFKGYCFFGRIDRDVLAKVSSYGIASYVSNIFWGLPAYILPIIAINTLTAEKTGYFVINWTIANFVLIAPRVVGYSLFAEGSRRTKDLWSSSVLSFILIIGLVAPVIFILWFRGDYVLSFFGEGYINVTLLRLLLISILPFTINSIFFIILRVQKRMKLIILFSAVLTASILITTTVLVHILGDEGLAMGWLLGHTSTAIVVFVIAGYKKIMNRLVIA